MRAFLAAGGFKGFTTTFEDLHHLPQLPGLAVQRLMAEGYGFGAEGDWKTAALVRAFKVMAAGRTGGSSFMEDYTYHLRPGAHVSLGCAHVGDLPQRGRAPALARSASCWASVEKPTRSDWSLTRVPGPARKRLPYRPGQPLPVAAQRGRGRGAGGTLAEIAGGAGGVGPEAGPAGGAGWIYGGGAHHTAFSQGVTANTWTFAQSPVSNSCSSAKTPAFPSSRRSFVGTRCFTLLTRAGLLKPS